MKEMKLWDIEEGIARLREMRETAEEEGAPPDELAAIDQAVKEYFAAEVRKIDGIAIADIIYRNSLAEIDGEIDRLMACKKTMEGRQKWLRDATMAAMQAHGITKVETPLHSLRIQGNGGVEPLDIPDWPKYPDGSFKPISEGYALPDVPVKATYLPDTDAIRSTLKSGLVTQNAKLLPRGQHLRIS